MSTTATNSKASLSTRRATACSPTCHARLSAALPRPKAFAASLGFGRSCFLSTAVVGTEQTKSSGGRDRVVFVTAGGEDRAKMYEANVAGADAEEWQPAVFVSSEQLAAGVKKVVLDTEIGREFVPLKAAYSLVGKMAQVKVNGGKVRLLMPSSAPKDPNRCQEVHENLLNIRGDISAGDTKTVEEKESIRSLLELHVTEKEAPEVYRLESGNRVELGTFIGGGLPIKPLHSIFLPRTLLIFASGKGIATVRALLNSEGQKGLSFENREDVRLYYLGSEAEKLCYQNEFEQWETQRNIKVRVALSNAASASSIGAHAGDYASLFEEDDVEYEPDSTGALLLLDGNMKLERQITNFLLKEAELSQEFIVSDSNEDIEMEYLRSTPEDQFAEVA